MEINGQENMFYSADSMQNLFRFRYMQRVVRHNGCLVFAGSFKYEKIDGKMVQKSETEEEIQKKVKHAEAFMAHMLDMYGELPE